VPPAPAVLSLKHSSFQPSQSLLNPRAIRPAALPSRSLHLQLLFAPSTPRRASTPHPPTSTASSQHQHQHQVSTRRKPRAPLSSNPTQDYCNSRHNALLPAARALPLCACRIRRRPGRPVLRRDRLCHLHHLQGEHRHPVELSCLRGLQRDLHHLRPLCGHLCGHLGLRCPCQQHCALPYWHGCLFWRSRCAHHHRVSRRCLWLLRQRRARRHVRRRPRFPRSMTARRATSPLCDYLPLLASSTGACL
jgi:hypothetical protein